MQGLYHSDDDPTTEYLDLKLLAGEPTVEEDQEVLEYADDILSVQDDLLLLVSCDLPVDRGEELLNELLEFFLLFFTDPQQGFDDLQEALLQRFDQLPLLRFQQLNYLVDVLGRDLGRFLDLSEYFGQLFHDRVSAPLACFTVFYSNYLKNAPKTKNKNKKIKKKSSK